MSLEDPLEFRIFSPKLEPTTSLISGGACRLLLPSSPLALAEGFGMLRLSFEMVGCLSKGGDALGTFGFNSSDGWNQQSFGLREQLVANTILEAADSVAWARLGFRPDLDWITPRLVSGLLLRTFLASPAQVFLVEEPSSSAVEELLMSFGGKKMRLRTDDGSLEVVFLLFHRSELSFTQDVRLQPLEEVLWRDCFRPCGSTI